MLFTLRCGAVLALLAALPQLAAAQTAAPATPLAAWPDSQALIREGVVLHDKGEYAAAVAKYEAVLPADSVYGQAQSELAFTLFADQKYELSVAAARRAIAAYPDEPNTHVTLGDALDELKKPAEAVAAYEVGLRRFPYNQGLYFNLAVTQLRQAKVAEAVAAAERSLMLRPLHVGSHRALGDAAALQNQPAHALMAWLVSLALGDASPRANGLLVSAENLAQGMPLTTQTTPPPAVTPNAAFAELDQLIESKVALSAGYTTKVKFRANVVKQAQLLIEKFPVDGPADDFWVRAYGPLVRALRQGDNLTTFTYLFLQSADDKLAVQWLKANKGKVETLNTAFAELTKLRTQQPLPGTPLLAPGPLQKAWFNDEGKVVGLGPGEVTNGDFKGSGPWVGISPDGAVQEEGQYTAAGRKTGPWRSLRPDGSVRETYGHDAQGERDGPAKAVYDNGQTKIELSYRAGKMDGALTRFDRCGNRLALHTFRAGDLAGPYVEYYPSGQVRYRAVTKADKVDGPEEKFFADGTPSYVSAYANGLENGPFVTYYPDKTPLRKGASEAGELHGPYTAYHPNGAVQETGTYAHGKRNGPWRETYATGKTSVEKTFDAAGELHGDYRDFDLLGHLFSVLTYDHGRIVRLQYLDPAGKTVLDQPVKKSLTAVRLLDNEGRPVGTGTYLAGQMSGDWTWLYADGTVRERGHYLAGQKNGLTELFHANGKPESRTRYDEAGEEDGYYESYGPTGQPLSAGYYRHGQRIGPWKEYYATGQLSTERFYHAGLPTGTVRSYAPGGKLAQEQTLVFNDLKQVVTYDSTGKVLTRFDLKPDTKQLVLTFADGKPLYQAAQLCGDSYGPATWLRPDGSPESRFTQLDNSREGAYQSFHVGGQPDQTGRYCAGKPIGPWTFYYPNGQLREQGSYNTAGEQGEWTFNFANGQPEVVQHYLNGELHGLQQRFNPAGELLMEKHFERGVLLEYRGPGPATAPWTAVPKVGGPLRTTFANGKPAAAETYRLNEPDGTSTYYYASGAVFRRVQYRDAQRHGLDEAFWPGGQPMRQEPYHFGQHHGRARYYRPDGTPEREENHRCGDRHGNFVYFDAAGKVARTDVYWNNTMYR